MHDMFYFALGFGLGIATGIQIVRVCWPTDDESVWDRHTRERRMINDALEQKREILEEDIELKKAESRRLSKELNK